MKDSTKLFFSSGGIILYGLLKGMAPTVLDKSFDASAFLILGIVAAIVAVFGLIKYFKGK